MVSKLQHALLKQPWDKSSLLGNPALVQDAHQADGWHPRLAAEVGKRESEDGIVHFSFCTSARENVHAVIPFLKISSNVN